jgi:hypothetical protein
MNTNPPDTDPSSAPAAAQTPSSDDDARALARYRYLLKTAAPESIEQAHAQAIARLTPGQRQLLLQQVGEMLPPSERALAGPANDTPHGIARLITRAELQQPGTAERLFGGATAAGAGSGLRLGGVLGASLLGSVVGVVVGSAIGSALFGGDDPALADAGVTGDVAGAGSALPDDGGDFDIGGLFDV